jgi:DNA-binding NtrC family response regulator/AraC-like DNA-binding protein
MGDEREADSLEIISLLKLTAKWAAYFIKRQDVAEWSKERLGRSFRLARVSQELLRLEHSIEMASMSCLPVLIGGEPGTEKIHAAVAIHAFSERRSYPFVEVDCARLEVSMPFCMQQARRGPLCLHNLHLLSLDHQYALRDLLYPRLGQWTNHSAPNDVRIISITEHDLDVCGAKGTFLPSLLSELSFLSFHVPPIRCRKDDIPSLLKALQGDLEIAPTQEMDGNVRQVFRQHDWPGNLFELARVAAHLGILSGGQEVSLNDLHVHTPWLLEGFPEVSASASDQGQLEPPDGEPPTVEGGLERWIDDFIQGRPDLSSTLHDGVCKAIRFLHDNFAAAMTMDDLAKVANLSPSHLSYLFRKEIQATFKDLQQCIRIKQAKHLLRGHRKMTITEVAAAVGYMDLSYFERCFRRRVGQTPREYRRVNSVSLRP